MPTESVSTNDTTRRWEVAPLIPPERREQFPEIDPVVLQLLANRGLTDQAAIDEFLKPDFSRDIGDPFQFSSMETVVERVGQALKSREPIVVHGDYDADGVTSAAIIYETLTRLGASPGVYLPHREREGYGLALATVDRLADEGAKLIITTDCGTTNIPEIAHARERGVDVIVIDHHQPHAELPPAVAIVNPHLPGSGYPYREFAAVGVAFKVAQALLARHAPEEAETFAKWLLDLVAIGSVTDFVPLVGENRTLVQFGLIVLRKTRRQGLRALASVAGINPARIDTWSIGFQIGPRLNAASRVDHANTAFGLLVTTDPTEARSLGFDLNRANQERQRLTDGIYRQAREQVIAAGTEVPLVSAAGKDWPTGLLGLVATKLVNEFNRPAIVAGIHDHEVAASGRSISAFNMIAALDAVGERCTRWGGHEQACGFNLQGEQLPNLPAVLAGLAERAAASLTDKDLRPVLHVDASVDLIDVDWPLFETLEAFEPTGIGNPRARFLSSGLEVVEWQRVGKESQHLRLVLRDTTPVVRKMIAFGFGGWADTLTPGSRVDVVFEVGVNEWNGNRELQLKIIDLRLSSNA